MRKHASIAISVAALVIAVFGSTPAGEAALNQILPRNSVGTLQLKRNAVTPAKIAPKAVRTAHVLDGSLLSADFKAGQIPQGAKGDKGERGEKGERGVPGPTEGIGVTPATMPTLTNQYLISSDLASTFTTTRAGKLLLHKDANVSMDCPSASFVRWFLSLDGAPVPSSVRVVAETAASSPLSFTGITAESVPAGQHSVTVSAMCSAGAAGASGATVFSTGSVVVLG